MAVQGTTTQRPWVAPVASLVMAGLGAFLIKLCVFDVLAAAERHETISVNAKGVVLGPLVFLLGLLAVAATFSKSTGADASQGWAARFSNPRTKRLSPFGWVIVFALLAMGGGVYFWLTSRLGALGYDV